MLQALITSVTEGIHHRAELLVPLVVAGFFVGEFVAHYTGVDAVLDWCKRIARRFVLKLNRTDRAIATRLYRGIVATGMLVLPAMVLGVLLNDITPLMLLLLLALLGRAFTSASLLGTWRRACASTQKLEVSDIGFLFPDSHAVLRYLVLTSAERFASGVVGVCFWYIVGGLPMVLGYVVLAEIAPIYAAPVFGWASSSLFRVVHAIPKAFSVLFLTLGAAFTPRAKPLAVFRARSYLAVVARLLNVSLGGAMPERNMPWVGSGTPKLVPEHLARWLLLRLGASVWLLVALATPKVVTLLTLFIK